MEKFSKESKYLQNTSLSLLLKSRTYTQYIEYIFFVITEVFCGFFLRMASISRHYCEHYAIKPSFLVMQLEKAIAKLVGVYSYKIAQTLLKDFSLYGLFSTLAILKYESFKYKSSGNTRKPTLWFTPTFSANQFNFVSFK